jgi:hypothetical protein
MAASDQLICYYNLICNLNILVPIPSFTPKRLGRGVVLIYRIKIVSLFNTLKIIK